MDWQIKNEYVFILKRVRHFNIMQIFVFSLLLQFFFSRFRHSLTNRFLVTNFSIKKMARIHDILQFCDVPNDVMFEIQVVICLFSLRWLNVCDKGLVISFKLWDNENSRNVDRNITPTKIRTVRSFNRRNESVVYSVDIQVYDFIHQFFI